MDPVLTARAGEIEALCRRYGVRRLDVFGSAARASKEPHDFDFLVDFGSPHSPAGAADRYFGLLEGLQALLGKPVDLVVADAVRNPYLQRSIDADRRALYAA
jgi:hypothetical protein